MISRQLAAGSRQISDFGLRIADLGIEDLGISYFRHFRHFSSF